MPADATVATAQPTANTRSARSVALAERTNVKSLARVAAVALGLFALALAARLGALDTYVTIDESRWVQRASDFAMRIEDGDAAGTFVIGHPGVTTMWTAYLGMGRERAQHFSYREGTADATRREDYFDALIAARRPFAIIGALGVALVALLGWRLLGAGPAILGGLLLALEPFTIAHARVAHLDSTLSIYTAVGLLAALAFWLAGGHWGYLVLSGVAAGLAFLTKAPSVFVVGFVPLLVGGRLLWRRERDVRAWGRVALLLAACGGVALAVVLALWPAFRDDPVGTLLQMARFTERVGGGDHDNYFFGQALEDPGPFFYPLALLLRLAPLTLAGLACLVVVWHWVSPERRVLVLAMLAYCVGFGLMMSVAPKKFDRYLLPTFPPLALLAGLGLWTLASRIGGRGRGAALHVELATSRDGDSYAVARGSNGARPVVHGRLDVGRLVLAGMVVVVAQAAVLVPVFAYPLAYYNPLLGGSAFAQRAILVGWGEGLDQVGAYLAAQPRPLGEPTVATSYHRVLQAQLAGSALPLERVRMADYVVPYVNALQRGAEREVLAPYLAAGTPEHVVTINGIEYARVYRGPHYPLGGPVGAQFGGRVTLVEYVAAPGAGDVRGGEEVAVLLRWDRAPAGGEQAVVALVGADGATLAQDARPVGDDGPDGYGRPGEIHRLTIPNRPRAGEYRLMVRVTEGRGRGALSIVGGQEPGTDHATLRTVRVGAER